MKTSTKTQGVRGGWLLLALILLAVSIWLGLVELSHRFTPKKLTIIWAHL